MKGEKGFLTQGRSLCAVNGTGYREYVPGIVPIWVGGCEYEYGS
jgi:hypothetical protein